MRFLALFLAIFLLFPLTAEAERILEVQGVHVEKSDGSGRDGAVLEATRQAVAQAWTRLGTTSPLPDLSPAQLQGLTSYLDIASESAQSKFYSGTFNIGVRMSALARLSSGGMANDVGTETSSARSTSPQQQVATQAPPTPTLAPEDLPRWILIIPVREVAGIPQIWKSDTWSQTWNRAGSSAGISTATASGDEKDQQLLSQSALQSDGQALADVLPQFMRKYNAPAVALVSLTSSNDPPTANQEVNIEVSYMEKEQPDVLSAQSSLFISQSLLPNVFPVSVSEAQRLILGLASGISTAPQPGTAPLSGAAATPAGTPGVSSGFQTSYARPQAPSSATKLWVRIPLANPGDLVNYRQKINSIPGARFDITAMNRMYVEGNIVYSGNQQQLMQELSTRGLRQQ